VERWNISVTGERFDSSVMDVPDGEPDAVKGSNDRAAALGRPLFLVVSPDFLSGELV